MDTPPSISWVFNEHALILRSRLTSFFFCASPCHQSLKKNWIKGYALFLVWPIVASKNNAVIRHFLSFYLSYNYNLANYLCKFLNLHIPTDYCGQDTFTFVTEVTILHASDKFMVSFDVESLFNNIPLIEYIDLAVDYIMKGNPVIKLGRDNLTKLFFFSFPLPRPIFPS